MDVLPGTKDVIVALCSLGVCCSEQACTLRESHHTTVCGHMHVWCSHQNVCNLAHTCVWRGIVWEVQTDIRRLLHQHQLHCSWRCASCYSPFPHALKFMYAYTYVLACLSHTHSRYYSLALVHMHAPLVLHMPHDQSPFLHGVV